MSSKDELYDAAVEIVINEGRGSISLLQTRMSIGYGRSARLIEMMTNDGILSAHNGGKPREVLITPEEWEMRKHQKQAAKQASATARFIASAPAPARPPVTDAPNMYATSTTAIVQPVESYSTQNVPFEPDAEEEYDYEEAEECDEESPFYEDEELEEDEQLNEDGSNYNELEARLLEKLSKAAQGYMDKNSNSSAKS